MKKASRLSLEEKAYRFIKDKIVSMEFGPGEPLQEEKLSDMLKMSRTPVREALKKLSNENLVFTAKGKGSFASTLTIRKFVDVYQARIALEGFAANLCASNVDPVELEKFVKIFIEVKEKAEILETDWEYLYSMGRKFHYFVVESSKNEIIMQMIKNLYDRIDIGIRHATRASPSKRIQAIDEHLRIIDALKKRDGAEAEKYMREHLIKALDALMRSY
jgi:DNA-binding GntR family transcriptional regulator